jgi:signal peptidase II
MDATPAATPAHRDDRPRPDRRRGRLVLLLAAICATVYALDQATKALALARLTQGEPVEVLDGVLQLRLVFNPGAAFSLASGMTWLLTVVAVVVVVVVVRTATRLGSRGWAVALGLLLAGALGNLTDRLVRPPGFARGHVIDFLELPNWPVFNVADSSISVAAGLIVVLGLRGIGVDGRRERDEHQAAAPSGSSRA